jgi:hypothetical protein
MYCGPPWKIETKMPPSKKISRLSYAYTSIVVTIFVLGQGPFFSLDTTKAYIWYDIYMLYDIVWYMWYMVRYMWWSTGQSFWLQIQRSRVRFPALPDFLSSSGSGTGSTQPREVSWGATSIKRISCSRSRKQRLTVVGICCADHVTPLYPQKLALTSPIGGGRSFGIVRSRTKATEFRV